MALCILNLLLIGPAAWAVPTVWINEIHYDNTGTDVDEFVEVAGPAGTDLSSWSILLYNGANGALYNTMTLSGTIPNQENGFGTFAFSYPVDGIQNGAPDGLALFDGTKVDQFLSYEGSFTALQGPASAKVSADILVSESGSTLVGYSLQLAGMGTEYSDFTWSAPSTASRGALNAGQAFPAAPPTMPDSGSSLGLLAGSLIGLGFLRRLAGRSSFPGNLV